MGIFVKSPFKSNRLETDPLTYGLREEVIREAVLELLNDRSLLITGSRGIGKSSLSYQLQNILRGDTTLLKRCGMSATIPQFVTVDYTCTSTDTLKSVFSDIVEKLNSRIDIFKKKYTINKIEANFSLLNIFTVKTEMGSFNKEPTILKGFIEVIKKLHEMFITPNINILIDEVDQLPDHENIAHFIKSAMEILNRNDITTVSFILAGQTNVIEAFLKQQPAFMRVVKHIDLKPLSSDDALYVLDCALERAEISTGIEDRAEAFLLQLACGYPYSIHILGHEAFNNMCSQLNSQPSYCEITYADVVNAIKSVLINCNERFETIITNVTADEQYLLSSLSLSVNKKIPLTFTTSDACRILYGTSDDSYEGTCTLLKKLCRKQILVPVKSKPGVDLYTKDSKFRFQEELFRVFLTWSNKNVDRISYGIFEI